MIRQLAFAAVASAVLVSGRPARAGEIVETSPNSLVVRHVASIAAPAGKVYASLIAVGSWWDPEHTYSGSASNLSIDPRAGGCFCEKLADGGSVQHMSVVLVMPGRMLRMTGGLGPLQASGASGALTFDLVEKDGATQVTMTYSVGGFYAGGLQTVASAVDSVLGVQLTRLVQRSA